MTLPEGPWSKDQAYLAARGDAFGWTVAWRADEPRDGAGRMTLSRLDWSVTAVFSHDGAFRYGRASGPGSADVELDLPAVGDVLEEYGSARFTAAEPGRARVPGSTATPGPEAGFAPGAGRPTTISPAAPRAAAPPGSPPEPTPPGESSTTAGISVPEPPELRGAWGPWPLVVIGVLVVCVVVFMIARILGW